MSTPTRDHSPSAHTTRPAGVTIPADQGRPVYDDIDVPVVVLVGAVSAIITVVLIAFVEGLTYHWQMNYIRERSYDVVDRPVEDLVTAQKAALQEIPERQIIGIDQAMQRVLEQYQTDDPSRSTGRGGQDPEETTD